MKALAELLGKLGLSEDGTGQKDVKERPPVSERLKRFLGMKREFEKRPKEDILSVICESDIQNIRETKENLDHRAFEAAVAQIGRAKKIYVIGIRNSSPLAELLGFYLEMLFGNVKVLQTSSVSELFEQMIRIDQDDVLIGISFPRYSMRTLKAMEFANDRNAGVIAVTDSIHSPMNLYSSCNLIASSRMISVVDSLTAPLSLVNALIAALCLEYGDRLEGYLGDLDRVWEEYQVYGGDEMERPGEKVELDSKSSIRQKQNGENRSKEKKKQGA